MINVNIAIYDELLYYSHVFDCVCVCVCFKFQARSGELTTQFLSYETPENGTAKATLETLRSILSNYDMVGNDEVQLCEHELLTILRANGNKADTFNYQKIIQQIISPTDEFK